eukprot:9069451-Lingulodinium_polyedra.AAC.1
MDDSTALRAALGGPAPSGPLAAGQTPGVGLLAAAPAINGRGRNPAHGHALHLSAAPPMRAYASSRGHAGRPPPG